MTTPLKGHGAILWSNLCGMHDLPFLSEGLRESAGKMLSSRARPQPREGT